MEGTPIPALLRNDTVVIVLFLLSILFTALSSAIEGQNILQNIKECFFTKNIKRLLNRNTKLYFLCDLMLSVQTIICLSIITLYYYHNNLHIVHNQSSVVQIAILFAVFSLFYLIKAGIYRFINTLLFDKTELLLWRTAYVLTLNISGFALLPLVVALLFYNFPLYVHIGYMILVIIINKVLLIRGCFKIFFAKKYGLFGFILYFCALEIVPLLLAVKFITETKGF